VIDMKKWSLDKEQSSNLGKEIQRTVIRGSSLEFIEYIYVGGSKFPVHSHSSEQLTIVLKGELVFRVPEGSSESEVLLEEGDLVIIPPDEPHGAFVPAKCEETVTYNLFSPVREELPGANVEDKSQ